MDGEEQQRAQQLAPAGLSLQVQEAALFSRTRFWMGSRQRGKGVTWAGEKEKAKVAQATPSAPTSLPTPKPKEQKKKMESTGQASFNPKSTGQSSFLANSSKEEEKLWRVEQKRPLRILCLHGYTQNGNIFRRKLRALETAVIKQIPGSKFIYPTAPHAANEDWVTFNEETDASVDGFTGESRGWWLHGEDPNGGTAVVSPGTATLWAQSLALLKETVEVSGPIDGVLGFSQGAAAAAILAATPAWKLRFCIVIGGYVPTEHPAASDLLAGAARLAIGG